jgi:hypothetical protein
VAIIYSRRGREINLLHSTLTSLNSFFDGEIWYACCVLHVCTCCVGCCVRGTCACCVSFCVLRIVYCALRVACCVCVLRIACCVLRAYILLCILRISFRGTDVILGMAEGFMLIHKILFSMTLSPGIPYGTLLPSFPSAPSLHSSSLHSSFLLCRIIVFDDPTPSSLNRPFEQRYTQLLNAINADHTFIVSSFNTMHKKHITHNSQHTIHNLHANAQTAHKHTMHISTQCTRAHNAHERTTHTSAQRTRAHNAHERTKHTSTTHTSAQSTRAQRTRAHKAHERAMHTSAQCAQAHNACNHQLITVFDSLYIIASRFLCRDLKLLEDLLQLVLDYKGEGLILRMPKSVYQHGRSPNLVKLKVCFEEKG